MLRIAWGTDDELRGDSRGMSAESFTRRWIGLFALFAGLIAIAPYFTQVVVANSGCHGAACAQADEVLSHYARRIILVVVLVPLLIAVAMRSLTAGGFGWAFPFALLMTAGALPLAADASDFHAPGVWAELLESSAIMPFLFLLLLLVAYSAHPDDQEGGGAPAWRTLLGFVALATLFVTAPAWVPGLAALPHADAIAGPLGRALANGHAALGISDQLGSFANYCLMAFVLAAAGLLYSGRGETMRPVRA